MPRPLAHSLLLHIIHIAAFTKGPSIYVQKYRFPHALCSTCQSCHGTDDFGSMPICNSAMFSIPEKGSAECLPSHLLHYLLYDWPIWSWPTIGQAMHERVPVVLSKFMELSLNKLLVSSRNTVLLNNHKLWHSSPNRSSINTSLRW